MFKFQSIPSTTLKIYLYWNKGRSFVFLHYVVIWPQLLVSVLTRILKQWNTGAWFVGVVTPWQEAAPTLTS